jgi:hypothetical protein
MVLISSGVLHRAAHLKWRAHRHSRCGCRGSASLFFSCCLISCLSSPWLVTVLISSGVLNVLLISSGVLIATAAAAVEAPSLFSWCCLSGCLSSPRLVMVLISSGVLIILLFSSGAFQWRAHLQWHDIRHRRSAAAVEVPSLNISLCCLFSCLLLSLAFLGGQPLTYTGVLIAMAAASERAFLLRCWLPRPAFE